MPCDAREGSGAGRPDSHPSPTFYWPCALGESLSVLFLSFPTCRMEEMLVSTPARG